MHLVRDRLASADLSQPIFIDVAMLHPEAVY